MSLDDYKVVLYRQDDGGCVAEVPAISGCCALMVTRAEALDELDRVFALIQDDQRRVAWRLRGPRPIVGQSSMRY